MRDPKQRETKWGVVIVTLCGFLFNPYVLHQKHKKHNPHSHFIYLDYGLFIFSMMSHLKDFHPTFLKSDESGKFYAPLYFEDYQDLADTICGLNNNIDLIADLMQDCSEHRTWDEIGKALRSVTRIIKQLDMAVSSEFEVLDKLQKT